MIYGNLTRDPELKTLPSGNGVVNTSVATNRVWKTKEGEKQEDVEYHNIVFFGKTAELVAQYLKKGSGVYVEGRLQTRSWEQDGVKKYMTEIIAEQMKFGPKKSAGGDSGADSYEAPARPSTPPKNEPPEINPDDIPF